jgi:hypothetical protein
MRNFLLKLNNIQIIVFRILKTIPSRFFFGNTVSFANNLKPYLYNKSFFFKKNSDLKKKGFKKIVYNLDKNIIDSISNKFQECIENKNISKFSPNKKSKFLINPLENIPQIKNLRNLIHRDALDYYCGSYVIRRVRAWRIFSDDSVNMQKQKYIYSNYWHFDDYRTDRLNVFILLNDNITRFSGSTKILDIETTKKLVRSFKFIDTSLSNIKVEKYLNNHNKIYYCEGNKGDIFIFNATKCLHSASIPENGRVRDVIQFELYKINANSTEEFFADDYDFEVINM